MQDKIILGFLVMRPLTSYELKKAMEESTSFFYNASFGSIHPALKSLQKNSFLTITDLQENGRKKKIYSITDSGRRMFHDWISAPIPLSKIKDDALVRLFFGGQQDPEKRKPQIEAYIALLKQQVEHLSTKAQLLENISIPSELQDVAKFQKASLAFGIDYYKFCQSWYQKWQEQL